MLRIQELYAAGPGSRRIAGLPCMRDDDGGPSAAATARLTETLRAERDRIDRSIRDLHVSRDVLDGVIDAASGTAGDRP